VEHGKKLMADVMERTAYDLYGSKFEHPMPFFVDVEAGPSWGALAS
jgi:hypothetical protein